MEGESTEAASAERVRRGLNFPKPKARGLGTVQDPTLPAGLWVAQHAPEFEDRAALMAYLREHLPYSARSVRDRYANEIARLSYEDDGVFSLPRAVWLAYGDEALLQRVLIALWLLRIPSLQRFIVEEVASTPAGERLSHERLQAFVERYDIGGSIKQNHERIPRWLAVAGLVERSRVTGPGSQNAAKQMRVAAPPFDATAFLILLHSSLAPTPRTVTVESILEHPFWRCLGGREARQVREALVAAEAKGGIDRYTRVDQLEQVTTRYSLGQLLERKVRV